jgi:hypothetical protein
MSGDGEKRQEKAIVRRKGTGKSAHFAKLFEDEKSQIPRELGWLLILFFVMVISSKSRRTPDEIENLGSATSRPPANAEYLLHLVLQKEERDAVIGDLNEEYGYILNRFGRPRADIWFYKQVFQSVWPFLRRAIARAATVVWLSRLLRQLIS